MLSILNNIITTLRGVAELRSVTLGPVAANTADTAVPRASVTFDGAESFPPDDRCDGQWQRLRLTVSVVTRDEDQAAGTARVLELASLAAQALIADPHRSGLASDLPIGKATEVGRIELVRSTVRPSCEATFSLRCHCEQ